MTSMVPMRIEDIPEILVLEVDTLSAWSRQQLEDELRQPAGFQFVVRNDATGRIEAFLCGRIMADEAEILKVNVAEDMRRRGVGYLLLDFALGYCKAKGVKNCFLELRASNTAAGNLYKKRGFLRAGSRKNYYDRPREDAILLELAL